jgi:hypothetical protein
MQERPNDNKTVPACWRELLHEIFGSDDEVAGLAFLQSLVTFQVVKR